MSKKKPTKLVQPDHPHQAAHDSLMAELDAMSDAAFFQTLVDAGIYTSDGKLTEPYRSPSKSAKRRAA